MTLRPSILALAAAIGLVAPACADEPAPSRIVVVGRATLEVPPDQAFVSVGVTNKGATASAAIDENSAAAARVGEAARRFGIEGRDIRTGFVSLQPMFRSVRDGSGGSEQKPDGYQAQNSIQVRVRDIGRLGEVLRRFVDEGANRITGVSFGLADRARAEREAGASAVDDAREQAKALVDAAGVRLGRVETIRSLASAGGSGRPMRMEALRAAAPPDVPVEPGTVEIQAEVEVTWAIAQP